MRIAEIVNNTFGKQRINALKKQKERASTQLKTEKDRQKQQKAVADMRVSGILCKRRLITAEASSLQIE